MYSAVSMVFCFLGVAFAYALLNAPLVAIIQILVYVGAISIVIIFAIMLTEVQTGGMELFFNRQTAVAAVVALVGAAVLAVVALSADIGAHRRQGAHAGPAPALPAHLRPLRVPVRARLAGARGGHDRRHRARDAREGALVNALYWWLLLAFLLFCIGAFGVLARRNVILVVMSLELMLNAVNIALVAIANFRGGARGRGHAVRPVHHRAGRRRGHRRPGHRHRQLPQQAHRADRHLRRAQGLDGGHVEGTEYMKIAVALIPLLPLLGFIVTLLFGKRWGKHAHIFPVAMVTVSAVLSIYGFEWAFRHQEETFVWNAFTWIAAGQFTVPWGFQVDTLTGVMLLVVGVIGMLVHYYSIGYMHGDEGYYRFFAYLNLFMFAMFVLILADSYLLLFLGWEGVGLCSYLLISFWFRKKSASQAGKKAFIVNRVGDFGFTLAMFAIFVATGTLQFTGVFEAAEKGDIASGTMTWICLLLFTGAIGKSAQFPLHVWLPDAMEGPTPVSALIHAATMVNAGVYMVARSYPLFIQSAVGDDGGHDRRHLHGHLRRVHRDHPERHQEGDRLLHHLVPGLHVRGPRAPARGWPASSTCSRTASSRASCSSAPAR